MLAMDAGTIQAHDLSSVEAIHCQSTENSDGEQTFRLYRSQHRGADCAQVAQMRVAPQTPPWA
jgi:hypothetical protein